MIHQVGRVLKVFKVLRLSKAAKFSQEHAAELEELLMTSASVMSALKMVKLGVMAFSVSHVLSCGWAYIAQSGD